MAGSMGSGDSHRPRTVDVARAVLAGAAVLALVGLAAERNERLSDERRAAADERTAAAVAAGIGIDVERGLRGVTEVATRLSLTAGPTAVGSDALESVPGATAVGVVHPRGSASAGTDPVLSATDVADPRVAEVLDRARGTGVAQMGAARAGGAEPSSLLVAPVYGPGDSPGAPRTATERRERLTGWVVALVDLGAVAADHVPVGVDVEVRDGAVAFGGIDAPKGAVDRLLRVEGRTLDVGVERAGSSGLDAATLAIAGVGGLVAVGVAVGALLLGVRVRAQRSVADRQAAQVRLIGDVAPLVQQSLDLSEVLPSVAVQLTDHFGLAGVALSTGASRGAQTELFAIGTTPDRSSQPVLQPPATLGADETLTLALQRGGRSVALLQIVAGRPLDTSELESLRALTELITAAMVNASLYASQQEALQRLRELDGLKTVFLDTASHELRTPATAIAGFASLLATSWDRFDEQQRRDFVDRIAANARSLSAVVQDLLDFSLLDRGSLSVALEPTDLVALVHGVVDRLGPAFPDRDIVCDLASAPLVQGNANGIDRVATNLLANAVKFSPPGSRITVGVEPDGDGAALVVSDQGPGVPPEEREQVFTRFYRGSGDAVVQTRGVGIGLSVVAEFVTRMHGEVAVDDAPGGGARFTVRLPPARDALTEEAADAPSA